MKVDQERAKRMGLASAGLNKKIVPYEWTKLKKYFYKVCNNLFQIFYNFY